MHRLKVLLCAGAVMFGAAFNAGAQNPDDGLPDQPFETVHMMIVSPEQEAPLRAAVSDVNLGFARDGCSACAYHLFKLVVGKYTPYNYMMTSDWPGRQMYSKLHASGAYAAANAKNPILSDLAKTEFYGRFVPVR